jgi:1-acyl-sn-glycerol-3-phosphate acyltransferase
MKDTPVLGQITKMAGCFYVERRNRSQLGVEIIELTEALNQNCNVTIFPEATSTNGQSVLRFKKPLFRAAILSKRSILPVTINYLSINNKPITSLNRDLVCWYGDMTFFSHFWALLKIRRLDVELVIQTPMPIEEYSDLNFDQCSLDSHQKVSSFFRPFTIPNNNHYGEVLL